MQLHAGDIYGLLRTTTSRFARVVDLAGFKQRQEHVKTANRLTFPCLSIHRKLQLGGEGGVLLLGHLRLCPKTETSRKVAIRTVEYDLLV